MLNYPFNIVLLLWSAVTTITSTTTVNVKRLLYILIKNPLQDVSGRPQWAPG